jgi:DNA-directed RNA polymerase subunit RPC12/RpoP
MAGKRGHCAKCNKPFTVPVPGAAASFPRSEWPAYIGVECHVCDTRMYGGPDQVGHELTCPDCGARTILPPPTPKVKDMPAALEGEQYELWDADDQPLPSEIAAKQPHYITVRCRRCETLMYATEEQVGQAIACPDCGFKNVVPPYVAPKLISSPITSDAETPLLDPATAPGERPSAISPELRRRIAEEERNSEYGQALERAQRTGKPIDVDTRGRPIIPRWPLVTGVLPFMFAPGIPARWLGAGLAFFASISIVLSGLQSASSGGLGAISGMCMFAFGLILLLLSSAMAFSMFLTIVSESSEGAKNVHNWPAFHDWFASLLTVTVAGMMSEFPGWAIGALLPIPLWARELLISASFWIFFPLMILSQLDIGSMWAIFSPRVLRSMLRCPFSWLTFYVETAAILFGCIAISVLAAVFDMYVVLVASLVGGFALLLYARLLGRLGWRLAEALPDFER